MDDAYCIPSDAWGTPCPLWVLHVTSLVKNTIDIEYGLLNMNEREGDLVCRKLFIGYEWRREWYGLENLKIMQNKGHKWNIIFMNKSRVYKVWMKGKTIWSIKVSEWFKRKRKDANVLIVEDLKQMNECRTK